MQYPEHKAAFTGGFVFVLFLDRDFLFFKYNLRPGSLRPASGDGRGAEYAKEIDKICALFFGNRSNTDFFLNKIEGRSQYRECEKYEKSLFGVEPECVGSV